MGNLPIVVPIWLYIQSELIVYREVSEMNEMMIGTDKNREVVPDLTNKVGKIQETMGGIWRSINRLDEALNGVHPKKEDCGEPLMSEDDGSVRTLERMVDNLYTSINDADLELREKLSILLG